MTTKAEWRDRALSAEAQLEHGLHEKSKPITFRNLTIDFKKRTIDVDGRTAQADARVLVIPILSTEHPLLARNRLP